MSGDDDPYRGTIAELAVFPLPEAVLFPGTLMPLHIFEPRYRRMTSDALSGSRRLSVALVTDATPIDEHGHPRFAAVAGVGDIIDHQKLPDGRYNILVLGRARARLDELPFVSPYRRARATLLEESGAAGDSGVAALAYAASRFAAQVRQQESGFELELPGVKEPGLLADACAHHLIIEAGDRQRVLETLDIAERVRICTEALAVQEALLSDPGTLQ